MVTRSPGEGVANDERRGGCCFQAFKKSATEKRFVAAFAFNIVSEKNDVPRANLELLERGT